MLFSSTRRHGLSSYLPPSKRRKSEITQKMPLANFCTDHEPCFLDLRCFSVRVSTFQLKFIQKTLVPRCLIMCHTCPLVAAYMFKDISSRVRCAVPKSFLNLSAFVCMTRIIKVPSSKGYYEK